MPCFANPTVYLSIYLGCIDFDLATLGLSEDYCTEKFGYENSATADGSNSSLVQPKLLGRY
jgi:hypothetical protein